MELQAAEHTPGFGRGEGAVEGGGAVGREIVEHDADLLGLGEVDVGELAHASGEVRRGASFGDLDLAPGLQVVLRKAPAHHLARQAVVLGKLDQCLRQQLQGPAGPTLGRVRAGRRHQQGLLLARELACRTGARLLGQRQFQVAFHKAPLGAIHGGAADHHPGGDLRIADTGVGRQQDLCSFEPAGRVLAATQKRRQLVTLRLAQVDAVSYVHQNLHVERSSDESDRRCLSRLA